MKCDLHVHTTMSDASVSPVKVVRYAARMGLECIAITDHDTFAGIEAACAEGERLGVRVLPGMEISTRDPDTGRSAHLLCYLPHDTAPLEALTRKTLEQRREQKLQIIDRLAADYPLTREMVLEYAGDCPTLYACHTMMALADLGYTATIVGDLMDNLMDKKGKYHVPASYPTIYEALTAVRKARGIAVLAHPGEYRSVPLLEKLTDNGLLDGAEYSHPRNDGETMSAVMGICFRHDLLMTGGSDFHGQFSHRPFPLGSYRCSIEVVDRLLELSAQRK